MASTFGLALLVGQVVLESSPSTGTVVTQNTICPRCGVRSKAIVDQMVVLQNAKSHEAREHASHDLRRVNWQCHPEVVGALSFALLNDVHSEVREEAAESLTRMRPRDPVAYQALSQAAASDPDRPTRRWAQRGLEAMNVRVQDRRLFGPNGPIAASIEATRRMALLPTNFLQRRVVLPAGILRRPIVVPGVTIESEPAYVVTEPPAEVVTETPEITPASPPIELESIPSAQPDAPFAQPEIKEPKADLAPVPQGEIDSKVNPIPNDLAPLPEPEVVPNPPGPAPEAEKVPNPPAPEPKDDLKPLTEKSSTNKPAKASTLRRKVASFSTQPRPVLISRTNR